MTDREAFEQWADDGFACTLKLDEDGNYSYKETAAAWEAWQAALAYRNEQASQGQDGFYLPAKSLNGPQIESIQRLLPRLLHAHMIDLRVRINGQWEEYEADWVKHLKAAPLPHKEGE